MQGRSPLNPFLEGPPQRTVPENLHSEAARQVIHHATHLEVLVVIPRERTPLESTNHRGRIPQTLYGKWYYHICALKM